MRVHCNYLLIDLQCRLLKSLQIFFFFSQDFVLLDVVLPHLLSTLPILTTLRPTHHIESLLTSAAARADLSCSTLTLRDHTSGFLAQVPSTETSVRQLKTHRLYRNYDPMACRWRFRTWLRVSTLVDNCGAVFSSNTSNLTLPLHVAYIHIANDSARVLGNASIDAHLSPLKTSTDPRTQLPFDYKAGKELVVHPMAIDVDRVSLEVALFVYTYFIETRASIRSMKTSISGLAASGLPYSPVFTSLSVNGTIQQAWYNTIVLDNDTTSSSIELVFYGCHDGGSCNEQQLYSIEVPFSLHDAFLSWDLSGWAEVNSSNTGNV